MALRAFFIISLLYYKRLGGSACNFVYLSQWDLSLPSDTQALFVFGRNADYLASQAFYFHQHGTERSFNKFLPALSLSPLHLLNAHAQRIRFAQKKQSQSLASLFGTDDGQTRSRAIFLHLQGCITNIERARFQ